MSIDQGKYICAYTDFGFKRLFGSELNKDILISFLNSFLNLKDKRFLSKIGVISNLEISR